MQRRENYNKSPNLLSLFSGCGGMDWGFKKAGYEVVWANDINNDACLTYRKNIGPILQGDVLTLDIPNFPNLDVITAGFPCQPFSNAGSRRGIGDLRGRLFEVCLNFVEKLKPKIVMLENVRGFISSRNEKGKRLIEVICEELTGLDYEVHFKLLNTADYGVPQNRIRLIIVGVRRDIAIGGFRFPEPVVDMNLTLENCLSIKEGVANKNDFLKLNPQAIYLGSLVPEGGSWKDIPYELLPERLKKIRDNMRKYRWPNFYRRFGRNEIAGTITAAFKPENAGVWHPIENRVLSAREVARIQSFPDDFIFEASTVKAIYEMIGNAFPPLLARAFGESFKSILNQSARVRNSNVLYYSQLELDKKPLKPNDPEVIFNREAIFEEGELDFVEAIGG